MEKRQGLPNSRVAASNTLKPGLPRKVCPDARIAFMLSPPNSEFSPLLSGLIVFFVSLHLAKAFGVRMQLREHHFQFVDVDV